MPEQELKQEYKEFFVAELARRDEMNKAVDRPITIITALTGIIYFAVSDLSAPATWLQLIRALVCIAVIGMFLVAVYFLLQSYFRHSYKFAPTPQNLEAYRSRLKAHYNEYAPESSDTVDKQVLDHIFSMYIEGAHKNAEINDWRSGQLYEAKRMLVLAVPLVITLVVLKFLSSPGLSAWIGSLKLLIGAP